MGVKMPKKKEEEEKQEEKKDYFSVGEIATQTEQVIINNDNQDENYTVMQALAKIMNDLEEIKKSTVG